MEPFFFQPLMKPAIWGGHRLAPLKNLPPADGVGESWEISAVPGSETVAAGNSHAGKTLTELIREHGAELMGRENYRRYGDYFPLLVKFIDSEQDLSIQVHPSDELAQRGGNPYGKTEMWYIVEAQPGAGLVSGFTEDLDAERCRRKIADGTLQEVLVRKSTAAGDGFFIPAGHIHSIGAGNLLVEIQQSSDCTYRVYDFNRRDADGNLRELHLEQALEALDFSSGYDSRLSYEHKPGTPVVLARCPYFTTRLCECDSPMRVDRNGADSFSILVAFRGTADMRDAAGNKFGLKAGQSVLVPACTPWVEARPTGEGGFAFLEVYIG